MPHSSLKKASRTFCVPDAFQFPLPWIPVALHVPPQGDLSLFIELDTVLQGLVDLEMFSNV
jgi:hypothetical protein